MSAVTPVCHGSTRCGTASGYRAGCRCIGCRFAMREHNARYRERNRTVLRERARGRELRLDYGLSLDDVKAMKRAQGWRCAICRLQFPPGGGGKLVHVDHCHKTNRVRGILCAGCNSAIGKLGDTADGVRRALAYLEGFESRV